MITLTASYRRSLAASAIALLLLTVVACAETEPSSPIIVEDAWSRSVAVGDSEDTNGAVYLTIRNTGNLDDELVAQRSQAQTAQVAEIHQSSISDGMMSRDMLPSVEVPAGGHVELAPGNYHIMLVGLTNDLNLGDSFPITLIFERAGEVEVDILAEQR
jgi:copper(I)-binding protein